MCKDRPKVEFQFRPKPNVMPKGGYACVKIYSFGAETETKTEIRWNIIYVDVNCEQVSKISCKYT